MIDDVTEKIVAFLRDIGLGVRDAELDGETFLPGIRVENGDLLVDRKKLLYPGDLLHEAGHLALAPAELRRTLSGQVDLDSGPMDPYEAAAVAWSYAAALHIGIDPRVVLHSDGYMGMGDRLLANFQLGVYLGLPPLVEAGLTRFPTMDESDSYPAMARWLA